MKKFLFIIPRTPVAYRTPLREGLWELAKKAVAADRTRRWEITIEMPKTEAEGGYPTLDRGWSIVVGGEEWGVHEILEGALSMHAARLQRENRVGRTRAAK